MDMEENATAPLVGNLSKILSKVLSCLEQGDPVRSEEILRQVLDAKPDNATAWHLRALTAQKMGNLLLAANYFDKAHNLSPENPNYLRDFGAALFAIGQIKEARRVLENAKNLAPEERIAPRASALIFLSSLYLSLCVLRSSSPSVLACILFCNP